MPRLNPRRSARRRAAGFTLAEVLIVLMILGIVGTAVFKVLLKQQQAYRDTSRQADMQREIRLTGSFLPAELRSTSSAGGDILAANFLAIAADGLGGIAGGPCRTAGDRTCD